MPVLYHFSEEPGIEVFHPRLIPARPEVTEPLVWAIEASHQHMYLFPRDCPRILGWPIETTTDADRAQWFGDSEARVIAHVEEAWLDRIAVTALYRYALPAETFESLHEAGMWVSRETVVPEEVKVITDLPAALRAEGVELRVLDRLTGLRDVWDTSLHWSGIRLRNAQDW